MVSSVRPSSTRLHDRIAPPGSSGPRESAPPAAADGVTLSGAAEVPEPAPSVLPMASRLALAAVAATGLFGAFASTAAAAPPQPSQSAPARGVVQLEQRPEAVRNVRTYIKDMLEANEIQGETLNTYDKQFANNWNTLQRVERRILENPSSLNDPAIRRSYEKIQAALDSAQIFPDVREGKIYRAATQTVETADGTRITMPMEPVTRTFEYRQDYSGAARMTDKTMESLRAIMK